MDKILKIYPSGKKEWLYKSICSVCCLDRGWVRLNRVANICRDCAGKKVGASNVGRVGPNTGKKFNKTTRALMSKVSKLYFNMLQTGRVRLYLTF